jgi:uncharacterized metal-binding protein YceD (DUF177 family)
MRFRVHKLVSGPVGKAQHEALDLGPTRFDEELSVSFLRGPLTFVRINESILVSGHIETSTTVQCVRSLEDFELPIDIEFTDVPFTLPGALVDEEDQDRIVSDDGWLDLGEMLREEIVMAIPINPISPRYSHGDAADLPEDFELTDDDWLTVRWKPQDGDKRA